MSYTLGKLLFDVLSELGQVTTFKASGGSTTTAINTNTGYTQTNLTGTFIVRRTTDGLAPEGEFSEVSAFDPSAGQFTFSTLTAAVGAGDIFGYASPLYPLYQVIEAINQGLQKLGTIALVDTTTLDTVNDQTEYAASLTWKYKQPYRIDIQGDTGNSGDNQWQEAHHWDFVPAAPGETGKIIFQEEFVAGRDIRIWYRDVHPTISAYSDVVSETVHPELARLAGALKASEWQQARTQGSEPGIELTYKMIKDSYEQAIGSGKYNIWKPPARAKIFNLGKR